MTQKLAGVVSGLDGLVDPSAALEVVATGATWSEGPLCDQDSDRLERAAAVFGIDRTYTNAAEMLRAESLDFVDIAITVPSRLPLVELAAAAGVHAICQKPLANSMADAGAMVDAACAAERVLMVHENFRWQSALRRVQAENRGRLDRRAVLGTRELSLGALSKQNRILCAHD